MFERLNKLRSQLIQKGIDAILISKPQNIRYFSGFTGSSAQLLITGDYNYLITDFRYLEQAKEQCSNYTVIDAGKKYSTIINELIVNDHIRSLGFEEDYIVVKTYEEYMHVLSSTVLIPFSQEIKSLRMVKDQTEINIIKKAASLLDEAYNHIIQLIKPGITEKDLALELEFYLKKNGAEDKSFEFVVASGLRGAMPHGVATTKKLNYGEMVTIDFGAVVDGYCSDMTRTIILGKINDWQRKVYNLVLESQEYALQNICSGMTCQQADSLARDLINNGGFGEYFGHSLGHGLGLEIHEDPKLAQRDDTILKTGMVVTIEPGVYVPGLGGVRIEDMALINKDSAEVFTKSNKQLVII
ncbi:MAG: Xaa-Pro peptidase family protein [Bacillota bacterium]